MEKLRLMDVGSYPLLSLQMASWVYWRLLAMKGNILNWNSHKWGLENLFTKLMRNNKCFHTYCKNVTFCGIVSLWPCEHVNPCKQVESWIEPPGWLNVFGLSDRWIGHVVPSARIPILVRFNVIQHSFCIGLWFAVHCSLTHCFPVLYCSVGFTKHSINFEPVTLVDNETRLIPRMDVPIHTMKIFKLLLLGR